MKTGDYNVDYEDAETFEKALNNGEDVLGRAVTFKVKEVHPDSLLGYDVLELNLAPELAEDNCESRVEEVAEKDKTGKVGQKENKKEESSKEDLEENTSLIDGLNTLGYSTEQVNALADILVNVGIPEVDDMWTINQNGTLQTKINTVDLYATDYDNAGYLAVYDAETDSVYLYGE